MRPYVNLKSLRQIEDPAQRYKTAMKEFETARIKVSEYVSSMMKEKGIALKTIAEAVNVDAGGLSRRLKSVFALPPESLEKFSSLFFASSCHEVLFGEPGITVLPKNLAVIAYQIERMTKGEKNTLLLTMLSIFEEERQKSLLPRDSSAIIIRKRIREIAEDKYLLPMEILGERVPETVKTSLKKYYSYNAETDDLYIGNLSTLMYYAFELKTSFDYFICQDYSAFTEIAYEKDGTINTVTDKIAVEFVSKYLKLSSGGQVKALGEAYKYLWLTQI